MRILLTSNKGFLGLSLLSLFDETEHELYAVNKAELNILNHSALSAYVETHKIDIIIHNAVRGGRRTITDSMNVVYENILMFENIASMADVVKKIIHFDSGASFNRELSIVNFDESAIGRSIPWDYYGLSKMNMALRAKLYDNIYTLRIFNCFGQHETPERMISHNIRNYLMRQPMMIHQNKLMDFFYIEDLFRVILHVINDDSVHKDMNMCYNQKVTLLDIANKINALDYYKVPVNILNTNEAQSYCGDGSRLAALNLSLLGLDIGLERMKEHLSASSL